MTRRVVCLATGDVEPADSYDDALALAASCTCGGRHRIELRGPEDE